MSTELMTVTDRVEYSKVLSASDLLADAFRKQPANILVALEYGRAIGLAPIVALSEINVINGKPGLSAQMMANLSRMAGHRVSVEGDENSATCTIRRGDDGSEYTSVWNVSKAKSAGLWGKGYWAKDPSVMLKWRAIAEAVRFSCGEVLGGLKYSVEELRDFTEPPRPKVSVSVPTVTRKLPEPNPVDIEEAEEVELDTVDSSPWDELLEEAAVTTNREEHVNIWRTAKEAGAPESVIKEIELMGKVFTNE